MNTGYILDFHDFCQVLSGAVEDPETYRYVVSRFESHGWKLTANKLKEIQISVNLEPSIPPAKAYELFRQNESLHRDIYNDAMSIWR